MNKIYRNNNNNNAIQQTSRTKTGDTEAPQLVAVKPPPQNNNNNNNKKVRGTATTAVVTAQEKHVQSLKNGKYKVTSPIAKGGFGRVYKSVYTPKSERNRTSNNNDSDDQEDSDEYDESYQKNRRREAVRLRSSAAPPVQIESAIKEIPCISDDFITGIDHTMFNEASIMRILNGVPGSITGSSSFRGCQNVIGIIDAFKEENNFYIVMDYYSQTMVQWIDRKFKVLSLLREESGGSDVSIRNAYESVLHTYRELRRMTLYGILKGLKHCHENSILHLDVKPGNVLIEERKVTYMSKKDNHSKESTIVVPRISDFGLSKVVYMSSQFYRKNTGTTPYNPPEMFIDGYIYDEKMDMWSMGCLIYETLWFKKSEHEHRRNSKFKTLVQPNNPLGVFDAIFSVVGKPPVELFKAAKPHIGDKTSLKTIVAKYNETDPNSATGYTSIIKTFSKEEEEPEIIELMSSLLAYNPEERLSAEQALRHSYFGKIKNMDQELKDMIAPKK